MIKEITGIILCGGKSTRMQTNKALLKIGKQTVIEIITTTLQSVFNDVILSANNINEYSFLNLPIIQDEFIDKGPLSGLHAAIKFSSTEKNFVISCDMPLIPLELINFIASYNSDKEIILPEANGKIQQLCGIYSKSIVSEINKIFTLSQIDKNIKGSVFELLNRIPKEIVDVSSFPFYNENIFFNMNSLEDYIYIKKYFKVS